MNDTYNQQFNADRRGNIIYYPDELQNQKSRPVIRFKCNSKGNNGYISPISIFLPIPVNLQISDSGTYNNAELGIIGGAAMAATRAAAGGDMKGALTTAVKSATNAARDPMGLMLGLAGNDQLMSKIGVSVSGEIKSAIGIGASTMLNKNVTTEFTGVGTRTFSFAFKMIASSKNESEQISLINKMFRRGLYPEADLRGLRVSYPPTWNINFLQQNASLLPSEISHIPKIFETYLTSFNSTYNSSANMWHADGAPLECDISVSFTETRALTLNDIKSLEDEPFQKSNFATPFPVVSPAPDVTVNGNIASTQSVRQSLTNKQTAATNAGFNSGGGSSDAASGVVDIFNSAYNFITGKK